MSELGFASDDKGFVLDSRVYEDYAALLLPRAIGYSAGLLDYFFRGRTEFEGIGDFSQSLGNPITS